MPEHAVYLYCQRDTVGIDFKQPIKLHGLLTVSAKTTRSEAAQAIFRLRKLMYGHTFEYCCIDENMFPAEADKVSVFMKNESSAQRHKHPAWVYNTTVSLMRDISMHHENLSTLFSQEVWLDAIPPVVGSDHSAVPCSINFERLASIEGIDLNEQTPLWKEYYVEKCKMWSRNIQNLASGPNTQSQLLGLLFARDLASLTPFMYKKKPSGLTTIGVQTRRQIEQTRTTDTAYAYMLTTLLPKTPSPTISNLLGRSILTVPIPHKDEVPPVPISLEIALNHAGITCFRGAVLNLFAEDRMYANNVLFAPDMFKYYLVSYANNSHILMASQETLALMHAIMSRDDAANVVQITDMYGHVMFNADPTFVLPDKIKFLALRINYAGAQKLPVQEDPVLQSILTRSRQSTTFADQHVNQYLLKTFPKRKMSPVINLSTIPFIQQAAASRKGSIASPKRLSSGSTYFDVSFRSPLFAPKGPLAPEEQAAPGPKKTLKTSDREKSVPEPTADPGKAARKKNVTHRRKKKH